MRVKYLGVKKGFKYKGTMISKAYDFSTGFCDSVTKKDAEILVEAFPRTFAIVEAPEKPKKVFKKKKDVDFFD